MVSVTAKVIRLVNEGKSFRIEPAVYARLDELVTRSEGTVSGRLFGIE